MICSTMPSLLGFQCFPCVEDGSVAQFQTPFTFDDGEPLPLFVEQVGGQVRFFDDGLILMHFLGRGLRLDNKRNLRFLHSICDAHGVSFNLDGEVEAWAATEAAPAAFAKYIGALMAVARWEMEQRGASTDATIFVQDVEAALRAWKPMSKLLPEPEYIGVSGVSHKLDFELDGQGVAATGSHYAKASSVLHKLVDITSAPGGVKARPLVVIDDRPDPDAAKRESLVLQAVGDVMMYTALASHAHRAMAAASPTRH